MILQQSIPATTLRELIAYATANPNKLNFGSFGIGGDSHLVFEWLKIKTGAQLTHIPYGGAAPALLAFERGDAHLLYLVASPAVMERIKSGLAKPIAVPDGQQAPALAGIPSFAQSGLPPYHARPGSEPSPRRQSKAAGGRAQPPSRRSDRIAELPGPLHQARRLRGSRQHAGPVPRFSGGGPGARRGIGEALRVSRSSSGNRMAHAADPTLFTRRTHRARWRGWRAHARRRACSPGSVAFTMRWRSSRLFPWNASATIWTLKWVCPPGRCPACPTCWSDSSTTSSLRA